MTYNEYAQLLETTNPDTGELYQPEDFNVINYEDTEGAMLQDAIWADTERLESDEDVRRTRRSSSSRPSSRAGSTPRDNPEEARDDHASPPARGSGPEPPALDDQRDQQAHLAVARRHRHDRRGRVGPDRRRCALAAEERDGRARSSPTEPPPTGVHERVRSRRRSTSSRPRASTSPATSFEPDRRHPRGGRQLGTAAMPRRPARPGRPVGSPPRRPRPARERKAPKP